MTTTPTLFICLQCGSTMRDEHNKKLPNPAASQLAGEVLALLNDTNIRVELTRCLEQCDFPIGWALREEGKHTFTFRSAPSAEALASTARAYATSTAENKLTKSQMPEEVRNTITGRIPPLSK